LLLKQPLVRGASFVQQARHRFVEAFAFDAFVTDYAVRVDDIDRG
jgi:hypothetical protein